MRRFYLNFRNRGSRAFGSPVNQEKLFPGQSQLITFRETKTWVLGYSVNLPGRESAGNCLKNHCSPPNVILSEAKNLVFSNTRPFADAQGDRKDRF